MIGTYPTKIFISIRNNINILTGNAMQRKQKRESNAFDLSCQCCGRNDSFYQTITKSTLCKVCDELLENDSSNKFPWSGFEK